MRGRSLLIANGARLIADAIFGKATEDAVVAFQKERGLRPDGAIGPATSNVLDEGRPPEQDQEALPARAGGPDFNIIVKHYEGRADKIYRIGGRLHGGYGHQLADGQGWREGDAIQDDRDTVICETDSVI